MTDLEKFLEVLQDEIDRVDEAFEMFPPTHEEQSVFLYRMGLEMAKGLANNIANKPRYRITREYKKKGCKKCAC